ncbi:uncharacterized protein LOC112679484 [Sipha flava]|uniref:Uncharacterized protein LOC112679484 n=2 Tax=Sipha flava TaxID=143950 RepID=A0A8B8F2S6_9HEMI|nr:uncharacterized protein LOC112679484 [Sipha flava]
MDSVRPKAPQVSFQGRTKFGCLQNSYPAPNQYTLKPAIQRAKPKTQKTFAPRFPLMSENGPAPNSYYLPAPDAYKYKRTTNTYAIPRRNPVITNDPTPGPNMYNLHKKTGQAKTFGKKPTYKKVTYITYDDNAY